MIYNIMAPPYMIVSYSYHTGPHKNGGNLYSTSGIESLFFTPLGARLRSSLGIYDRYHTVIVSYCISYGMIQGRIIMEEISTSRIESLFFHTTRARRPPSLKPRPTSPKPHRRLRHYLPSKTRLCAPTAHRSRPVHTKMPPAP